MSDKALIDFGAVYWRFWHLSEGEEVSSAARKTLGYVRNLYGQYGVENIVVAVDAPPYKRNELYDKYKANRKPKNEAAIEELKKAIEKILDDGITVAKSHGYEADDVICTLLQKEKYDVYAMDKDLLQCADIIGPDGKLKTAKEYFGVEQNRVVDFLALVGDSADNIPGVKGVGAITAKKMLETFGSIKGIYDALNEDEEQFKKTAKSLREAEAFIDTAYQLIKLEDNCEIEFEKREAKIVNAELVTEEKVQVATEEKSEPVAIQVSHEQLSFRQSLEPVGLTQLWKVANAFVNSRLYTKFATAEAAMVTIMRGRALGIDATTAMDGIHVIQGKPTMSASLMVGVVMASPKCEYMYCSEMDEKHAVWKAKRRGTPQEVTREFTIEQAAKMGLTNKDNWRKQPDVMLQWRCASALCRQLFPDVINGFYANEEME